MIYAAFEAKVRALILALPKCSCGRMATKEILVPHQYTYLACTPCTEARRQLDAKVAAVILADLGDYTTEDVAMDLPHAVLVIALLNTDALSQSETLRVFLTTPRTMEEQAQHDHETFGIPLPSEQEAKESP
jgi:hypothetical protein